MIRLTDEEIKTAIKIPTNLPLSFEACGIDFERVAEAQYKKMVAFLESKTVKAYGGNVIILSEDWQDILKEVE